MTTNRTHYPWLIWLIGGFFVLFQVLLQTSPSIMIPSLERAFSINAFGVSLLSSSFFFTYVILQIPAGMLIDRLKPRKTLTFSLVTISILSYIFAHAHVLFVAEVTRVLMGVFSAPAVVATLYLAAHWFPAQRFALLAGMTEMMGMMGGIAGEAVLARSVNIIGWRTTIMTCALIALIAAFLTWIIVQDKDPEVDTHDHQHKTHVINDLLSIITVPQVWINGIYSGLLFSIIATFAGFWCVPFLMQIYPITLNEAADASSMIFFGAALGAPFIGLLSDKFGLHRLPMMICALMTCVILIKIIYYPLISINLVFLLLFAAGFFSGAYVLPFAVARDLTSANVRGSTMGFINMMCIIFGSALFQPLIGWLLEYHLAHAEHSVTAYENALMLLPVALGLAGLLALGIKEKSQA